MSSILAISITYALLPTENSMVKGPRRAAQLVCTRGIFTAIAPRSVEKLLNTKRTLSLVSQSDGFQFLRECGFYETEIDDDFVIETLSKIVYLQRVYFSRGCHITMKTANYLLRIPSLEHVSMYMEDENFPVKGMIKLLKQHRSESVRASVANSIIIHEQDHRGTNTRTLKLLRRHGADHVLFNLIEKPVKNLESLAKYCGALGCLFLSFLPTGIPPNRRTAQTNNTVQVDDENDDDTPFRPTENQPEDPNIAGITPKYVLNNVVPIYDFLSSCSESADVRGAAHLMLGSCTARIEFAPICREVINKEFFTNFLAPILTRLAPLSPEEVLVGGRWEAMREHVSTTTFDDQNNSTSVNYNEGEKEKEQQGSFSGDGMMGVKVVSYSIVPSLQEGKISKLIRENQRELSYFSWVLQNVAHDSRSREVLLSSEDNLRLLVSFLKVFKRPPPATTTTKTTITSKEHNNNNDDDETSNNNNGVNKTEDEEDAAFPYSGENTSDQRCDLAAYNYSVEARHRCCDTIRFALGHERQYQLRAGAHDLDQVSHDPMVHGRDNMARTTDKLISSGIVQHFANNIDAGPRNFRSNETFLEMVMINTMFFPLANIFSFIPGNFFVGSVKRQEEEAFKGQPLRVSEIETTLKLLSETTVLKSIIQFLHNAPNYWNKVLFHDETLAQHKKEETDLLEMQRKRNNGGDDDEKLLLKKKKVKKVQATLFFSSSDEDDVDSDDDDDKKNAGGGIFSWYSNPAQEKKKARETKRAARKEARVLIPPNVAEILGSDNDIDEGASEEDDGEDDNRFGRPENLRHNPEDDKYLGKDFDAIAKAIQYRRKVCRKRRKILRTMARDLKSYVASLMQVIAHVSSFLNSPKCIEKDRQQEMIQKTLKMRAEILSKNGLLERDFIMKSFLPNFDLTATPTRSSTMTAWNTIDATKHAFWSMLFSRMKNQTPLNSAIGRIKILMLGKSHKEGVKEFEKLFGPE